MAAFFDLKTTVGVVIISLIVYLRRDLWILAYKRLLTSGFNLYFAVLSFLVGCFFVLIMFLNSKDKKAIISGSRSQRRKLLVALCLLGMEHPLKLFWVRVDRIDKMSCYFLFGREEKEQDNLQLITDIVFIEGDWEHARSILNDLGKKYLEMESIDITSNLHDLNDQYPQLVTIFEREPQR